MQIFRKEKSSKWGIHTQIHILLNEIEENNDLSAK